MAYEMHSAPESRNPIKEGLVMMVQCCVCRKIRRPEGWVDPPVQPNLLKEASHGYCPDCAKQAYAEVEAARAAMDILAMETQSETLRKAS